jgi:Mor family transcriptional regulator
MNWLDDLKIEELPSHYQEMAVLIGLEATMKLAKHYNKTGFYFTGLDDLVRAKKEQFIKTNFTGDNHKELARATEWSERWVYEILKGVIDDSQPAMF